MKSNTYGLPVSITYSIVVAGEMFMLIRALPAAGSEETSFKIQHTVCQVIVRVSNDNLSRLYNTFRIISPLYSDENLILGYMYPSVSQMPKEF